MSVTNSKQPTTYPNFLVVLELLKPITWFPPMWAYACGVISSGASIAENWDLLILGIIVAGPVVCPMAKVLLADPFGASLRNLFSSATYRFDATVLNFSFISLCWNRAIRVRSCRCTFFASLTCLARPSTTGD